MKKKQSETQDISIVEAVETLSNIADLDFETELGVTKKHHIVIQDKDITYRTVHWMSEEEASTTLKAVRDTFGVVLKYLREFYKQKYLPQSLNNLEGVKDLMVLVGEAAKKLDRYTSLFKQKIGSVTDLKEYKQLQSFYHEKVAKAEDEQKKIEKLFSSTIETPAPTRPRSSLKGRAIDPRTVFVDFDAVRKDTEYELFFLRKEGQKRFYSQRLLRNIKLVCDFGGTLGIRAPSDPLVNIEEWQDRMYHVAACDLLDNVEVEVERFFRVAAKFKNRELVLYVSNAVMALYLARNPRNLERNKPPKNCQHYFHDFQYFLRKAMETTDYQHNLVYHPAKSNRVDICMMELVHALCFSLYAKVRGHREILKVIQGILRNEGIEEDPDRGLGQLLRRHEQAFRKATGKHPNGPLLKVLEVLEEKITPDFDPLLQGNLPHHLFDVFTGNHKCALLRLPCPVRQNQVSNAEIIPEFRGLLRSYARHPLPRKHLLLNLQDRTSWKEHARCQALEHLQKTEEFAPELTVVTLPKDTDFYYQLPPYHKMDDAQEFTGALLDHLRSDASGFYFEKELRGPVLGAFLDKLVERVHMFFFDKADTLHHRDRLNFIELVYLFIQLRLVDLIQPTSVSLSCKDSLDIGAAATATFYGFLELLDPDVEIDEILVNIELFLFEPALLTRERDILPERFERAVALLEVVESAAKREGGGKQVFVKAINDAFGTLFDHPMLHPHVRIPRRRHHAIS